MKNYDRIGAEVSYGEVDITLRDANAVKDMISTELMLVARSPKIDFGPDYNSLQYCLWFRPLDHFETDMPDIALTARVVNFPDGYSMKILRSVSRDSARHDKKRAQYDFEVVDNRLIEAKRTLVFKRSVGRTVLASADGIDDTFSFKCTGFERPISNEDCIDLLVMLDQGLKRARVS